MRTKTDRWAQYPSDEIGRWTQRFDPDYEHRRVIREGARQRRQEALLQQLVEMNERRRRENDPTLN